MLIKQIKCQIKFCLFALPDPQLYMMYSYTHGMSEKKVVGVADGQTSETIKATSISSHVLITLHVIFLFKSFISNFFMHSRHRKLK